MSETLYTVSQITRAAGLAWQSVQTGPQVIAPAGTVATEGQPAAAWRFADLPLDWQLESTRRGVKRGFENGEQFLANLPEPWKCPLPWSLVSRNHQEKAVKLQKALARVMELRAHGTKGAELESIGLEDYKAVFGYGLKDARHFRRLLHRTIDRDAGDDNWQRLEIYLDDRAFRRPRAPRQVVRNEYVHRELDETIATLENRQSPTATDREFLWDAVFRHYEQHTGRLTDSPAGNRERRLFRASLVHYLFKAFPERTLCATAGSLKRRFDEKLMLWREKGCTPEAMQDRRGLNSGNFSKEDFSKDPAKILERAALLEWDIDRAIETLTAEGKLSQFAPDLRALWERAILHDGNIALAYRLLHEERAFSQAFCDLYPFDVRTAKSEVPARVRAAVAPLVKMSLDLRHSEWRARLHGPYIQQEHMEAPGDWFCADDVSFNHYFKEQLPNGRWRVLRGECLLMTDYKTSYPLEFMLIAGHYNGEHVRNLVLKTHDRVGLPRLGFKLDNGVWKSRLVVGDRIQGTPVHWREAENGLRAPELGLQVRHARARNPRGKAMLEGAIGIVQQRMRCLPGFVGFNEQVEKYEREQSLIERANRQDHEALSQFPTQAEWRDAISEALERFAHDPQNGDILKGKSPAEAWAEGTRNRPLRKLADEARYILSTHRKEITVRQEGIVFTIRGHRRIYYNDQTGRLIGHRALAFYNLELPDVLTVSDLERKDYFTVRAVKLPAMTATPEQFAAANRLRKAHMAPAKAIFGSIKHETISTITRDNEHSEAEKGIGRFHNAEMVKAKAQDSERARKVSRLQRKAVAAGIRIAGNVRNPDDALEAIERRQHFLEKLRQDEASQIQP